MTPQEEIEALIARVAMADRKAFRALYSRTSAKLFGIALRVLRDEAAAEDVLQDVYVRVWNRAGAYRSNGYSPMTWLITITRNAAIDRLRKDELGKARISLRGRGETLPVSAAFLHRFRGM